MNAPENKGENKSITPEAVTGRSPYNWEKKKESNYFIRDIPGGQNIIFGLVWIVSGAGIILYLLEASVSGHSIALPVIMVVFGLAQSLKGVGQFIHHSEDEWDE